MKTKTQKTEPVPVSPPEKLVRVNFQVSEKEMARLKIYAVKNKTTIREIFSAYIATLPD